MFFSPAMKNVTKSSNISSIPTPGIFSVIEINKEYDLYKYVYYCKLLFIGSLKFHEKKKHACNGLSAHPTFKYMRSLESFPITI